MNPVDALIVAVGAFCFFLVLFVLAISLVSAIDEWRGWK